MVEASLVEILDALLDRLAGAERRGLVSGARCLVQTMLGTEHARRPVVEILPAAFVENLQ